MEQFELETYLSNSAKNIVNDIIKASFSYKKASLFMMKFGVFSQKAADLRREFEKKNEHIPPFIMASITNSCNLQCKGCFARANHTCEDSSLDSILSFQKWEHIFMQAKELGISFILLLGGEPLLRRDIIEMAGNIPEILFPIFTNSTLLNEDYLTIFDKKRNLIPVLSIEGNKETTDSRRGDGIYTHLENTMKNLKDKKILFGTSITVTSQNMEEVVSDEFMEHLNKFGCKSVIFVEYVPVKESDTILALNDTMREYMAYRLSSLRKEMTATLFLSFPGDEKAFGGCLAAGRGFFHINAQGGVEPCPFSPYSDTNLADTTLLEALHSPLFQKLNTSGILSQEHIGGCSLYAQDHLIQQML